MCEVQEELLIKRHCFLVLLGNEFDVNVGLKKRRKRSLEDDRPGPEKFLKKFLEIVSKLEFSGDEIRFRDGFGDSGYGTEESGTAAWGSNESKELYGTAASGSNETPELFGTAASGYKELFGQPVSFFKAAEEKPDSQNKSYGQA